MPEASPSYSEVIECHGMRIPFVAEVISDRLRNLMVKNRYEGNEVRLLNDLLRPRDRVLDLGAGVGLVSAVAARITGPEAVVAVEANPELVPVIRETHRLNDVAGIRVINGVGVSGKAAGTVPFYVNEQFWSSSLSADRHGGEGLKAVVDVPLVDLNALLAEHRPTVLSVDIEGGEIDLFDTLDLTGVRAIIMELHPRAYGNGGTARIMGALMRAGFVYDAKASRGGTVVVLTRFRNAAAPDTRAPRIAAVTCMKNEAPFILEWIAYHRAIGVTDFLVFTNDCDDGTDALLDRLDDMGIVRHLPNFTPVIESGRHQPMALAYARMHKEVHRADWLISMDVDEFINIHVGEGRLADLFAALPGANAITLTHKDFGCNGIDAYEDRPVIEQMTRADNHAPTEPSRRGVKTLIHRSVPSYHLSNHRPHFDDPRTEGLVWVDGAGRPVDAGFAASTDKGLDARGTYDLVQLNHYPVRSMQSYLVKSERGNVVVLDHFVGQKYWTKRNLNAEEDATILRRMPLMEAELEMLLADAALSELQRRAVKIHRERIETLMADPEMAQLYSDIRADHERTSAPGAEAPAPRTRKKSTPRKAPAKSAPSRTTGRVRKAS